MKKVISFIALVFLLSACSTSTPKVEISSDNQNQENNSGVFETQTEDLNPDDIKDQIKNVYFDFDKFSLNPDQQSIISQNAHIFNSEELLNQYIKIEGNCDEWGSDEYNYALGLKRAKSVKDELIQNGVDSKRISIVSYGEGNPVCSEKNKICDTENRRVEFKLIK